MNKFALTAAFVAALPLSTSAASLDYFLKIDTIKGESADSKHKDEIDVLSWAWGVSNAGSVVGGGGGGSRPVFEPFSWEQGLDSSFVPLFLGVAQGTHFKSALLTVRRDGKEQQEFFKMTLSDVRITSLKSQAYGASIIVDAAMSYDKIAMSYRPQKDDGSLGSEIKGEWDLKQNEVTFSGDPMVMLGLAEAGGSLNFVGQVPEPATWASLAAGLAVVGAIVRRRRSVSAGMAGDGG
jgi:type VI secretion system secreted protein Hcp